jgi:hypothetical protein
MEPGAWSMEYLLKGCPAGNVKIFMKENKKKGPQNTQNTQKDRELFLS